MCDQCGCGQPSNHHHHHEDGAVKTTIDVARDVLAHNQAHAASLRDRLASINARLVNVIGSPGCGKTRLIAGLLGVLSRSVHCVVVEGDLATDNDARRIRETGTPVFQIQTGTVCHLTAHDVEHALEHLPLTGEKNLVIVENVGNLVCPSMFDLGESMRIVCLSSPEGTDKPQKYPVTFREADLVIITKGDLIEHVDFDLDACLRMIRDLKPSLPCLVTSMREPATLEPVASALLALWK